ncbi:MAG: Snf7 family protein [Candidatus Bathyarchaeia archaeon]
MRMFKNWDDAAKKSLVSKIEDKMKLSRSSLKERIVHAVYRLETQLTKLQQTSARLQQRDKEMFERCVGARLDHDEGHAVIYANECVEIRKMAKVILASELALERVILRLKTIEEVGDVLVQMAPVVGVVRETKGKLSGIIPEVSNELEDINSILSDALLETGEATAPHTTLEAATEEARNVLEEAAAKAEEKIGERFPDLPEWKEELASSSIGPEKITVPDGQFLESTTGQSSLFSSEPPAAVDAAEESVPQQVPTPIDDERVDQRVLDYLTACGGDLSIRRCASELEFSPETVKKALERLSRSGKIAVE